jgi:LemA protein
MKKGLIVVLVIVGLLLILIASGVSKYNTIIGLHEAIQQAWAQVDNQLKRRSDLIPNLVNTVKGYAAHEKEVFENIAAARAKLAGAANIPDKIAAARNFEGALARLLAVVENYPNLKADQSFNRLMDELSGTENRIAVERMRYNRAVETYNVTIKKFPGRIYASLFGFSAGTYYQVEEKDKVLPEVKF